MTVETIKTELAQAEEAELQSDEQLQKLIALIDRTSLPGSPMTAGDCHKLVSAALDLNTRLKARTESLRKALRAAQTREVSAARKT